MTDQPQPVVSEDKMPFIAYLLYIIGFVIPILPLVGLILCYLKRGDAPAWHKTHYTYLIRTFWIGLLIALVGGLLAIFGIGLLILLGYAIWYLVRTIKGLLEFNKGNPIANPTTWLI